MGISSTNSLLRGLKVSLLSVLRPTRPIYDETELPSRSDSVWSVLYWGAAYTSLYALLAAQGHQPSMTRGLPVAADFYYFAAALYCLPLSILLAMLVGGAADIASGQRRGWWYSFRAFAPGYAGPLLWFFVLPDIAILLAMGFETLAIAMRFTAPIAVSLILVRTYAVSRSLYSASASRSAWMTLVAAAAQAMPAALLLR